MKVGINSYEGCRRDSTLTVYCRTFNVSAEDQSLSKTISNNFWILSYPNQRNTKKNTHLGFSWSTSSRLIIYCSVIQLPFTLNSFHCKRPIYTLKATTRLSHKHPWVVTIYQTPSSWFLFSSVNTHTHTHKNTFFGTMGTLGNTEVYNHNHEDNDPEEYLHGVNFSIQRGFKEKLKASLKEALFPDDPFRQFKNEEKGTRRVLKGVQYFIPIFEWLPTYNWRLFCSDLIAGLTISSLAIPQGISYAKLADLPPLIGLCKNQISFSSFTHCFSLWFHVFQWLSAFNPCLAAFNNVSHHSICNIDFHVCSLFKPLIFFTFCLIQFCDKHRQTLNEWWWWCL